MKQRGFTLIELLVTLTLLAILAGAALPLAQLQAQRSREQNLRQALWSLRNAIDEYKRAYDEGRLEKTVGSSGYPPNLRVLVDGVSDISSPDAQKLYFLRRIPRDPFFPDQTAPPETTWGLRSYASPAEAPRAGADVYDVYSLNPGTALDGQPYRLW
ncbi:type II secretion system pseudopilin PulG [Chitinimonas prasina]|uniref:Type II secretion system pseudopilin PulG n=1 Tax=Chitinimonas prasina TaxID=1434937 RepID=A0ABQ5YEF0_9NEIS|nr:type II secretion system protein [Chitinimonas prasina]GLR12259.1 type II secretion system pseudopilin PulG [Chitinimonas prasina]